MFHVEQIWTRVKSTPIYELLFYFFILSIPIQLRIVLNPAEAYIDYYFSYHKAIFIYLSDILFLAAYFSYVLFKKDKKPSFWLILPALYSILFVFHVEHTDLLLYSALKILQFWLIIGFIRDNVAVSKNVMSLLIASGVFQAILAVIQFHIQGALGLKILGEYVPQLLMSGAATLNQGSELVLRAYGTFPHPNVLGGFMVSAYSLLLFVSRETKRWWFHVIMFILAWGLLVSYSRSAWIAWILVSTVFLIYLLINKSWKTAFTLFGSLVITGGLLFYIYSDTIVPRTTESASSAPAIEYRNQYNSRALDLWNENLLTGVGSGQYIPSLEKQNSGLEPWNHQPPHNVLLFIGVEIGIVGVLLWLVSLYRIGFTWNNLRNLLTLLVLPIFSVIGALDHYLITIQQGILLSAVLLGLITVIHNVSHHDSPGNFDPNRRI